MKFDRIMVITTPNCDQCGILLRNLEPLARTYNLQIDHLVAKDVVKITNKGTQSTGDIRLYREGRYHSPFPDHLPQEFPILIYGNRYTMVGGDSCKALNYILSADVGKEKSVEQLVDEGSNIDSVIKDYYSTPGAKGPQWPR